MNKKDRHYQNRYDELCLISFVVMVVSLGGFSVYHIVLVVLQHLLE